MNNDNNIDSCLVGQQKNIKGLSRKSKSLKSLEMSFKNFAVYFYYNANRAIPTSRGKKDILYSSLFQDNRFMVGIKEKNKIFNSFFTKQCSTSHNESTL